MTPVVMHIVTVKPTSELVIFNSLKAIFFSFAPKALVSMAKARTRARLMLLMTNVERVAVRAASVPFISSLLNLSPLAR